MVKVLVWLRKEKYEWGNERLQKAYNRWMNVFGAIGVVLVAVACYAIGIMATGNLPPEWSKGVIILGAVATLVIVCGTECIRYADKVHKEQ